MNLDSLKTLMDKNEYELVIKLTENSEDSLAIFYRVSAFIAIDKDSEALATIKEKRKILQGHLSLLIKMHLELLCMLGKFDEAYDELKYYQELPYENQETEELLQGMNKYIRQEERNLYIKREVGQDEISQKLLSNDDNDVLTAIDQVRSLPLENFILPLSHILKNHPRQAIRSFTLLLFVSRKYNKKISFLHIDKIIEVIPASLDEPFIVSGFKDPKDLSMAFQDTFRDPSVTQNALHIISSYMIYIYPDKIPLIGDEIIVVFGYLAKDYLKSDNNDLENLCLSKGLDKTKIKDVTLLIKEQLKYF